MSKFLLDDDNNHAKTIQYLGFSPKTAELKCDDKSKRKITGLYDVHI